MPKEESFPFPLKYIDVTRNTHTSLDVMLEKYWWLLERGWKKRTYHMYGQASQDYFIERKATWQIYMVRRETWGNKQPQDPTMYGQICGSICLMQRKSKVKQKWAIEKPKPDNATQLRGIFFIEPNDEEFKHTTKNARRKLEIPISAAMPFKTPVNCRGATCRNIGKHKTKYACIVDADESMRIRLEGVPHFDHEDHIFCKRI